VFFLMLELKGNATNIFRIWSGCLLRNLELDYERNMFFLVLYSNCSGVKIACR